jgi:hypothetical protein
MNRRQLFLGTFLALAGELVAADVPKDMLPRIASRDGTGPRPWVTVEPDGSARTIIPSVATAASTTSTISPPPARLTQTAAWTLTISSSTTTSIGISPVVTAYGPGEQGSFLLCDNYEGSNAPFCQPEEGSVLFSNLVYYGSASLRCPREECATDF